jgi:acetylornithine deacetylase
MTDTALNNLQSGALSLLKTLISTPSFSREEHDTASAIEQFLQQQDIATNRYLNNVWACNKYFDRNKPTILLNSHHDTVKPNIKYTLDPFSPIQQEGKLFGLGSNDAGGSLVSLIATFIYFYSQEDLGYNLVLAATAEEEISGKNGIEAMLKYPQFLQATAQSKGALFSDWCAIVGEPTQMQMAVAEKGLMVLDAVAHGKAGHAARNEGVNAIYKAVKDIGWLSSYQFDKVSDLLGPVKMTVSSIETENKAHNVVPAECRFVIDIRVNELYTLEQVLEIVQSNIESEVKPRSLRMRSSGIALEHPLVKAGLSLNRTYYGSPTTSDKALMPFPSLKMGPGDSARSHTADEYIFIDEVKQGIDLYIQLLNLVIK